jgi:hypothetical protein
MGNSEPASSSFAATERWPTDAYWTSDDGGVETACPDIGSDLFLMTSATKTAPSTGSRLPGRRYRRNVAFVPTMSDAQCTLCVVR